MGEPQTSPTISTRLQRIAEKAKASPSEVFRSLAHLITPELLKLAAHRTRKDGAPGVDGQSGEDYMRDLDANIAALWERLQTQRYRAPAVRRVHIPKADGRQRPLGIPTFEDKIVQRAVVMVLECIYEQDFLPCSYGFRPGRSAHGAVEALWEGMMSMGGGWVLDADIRDFFGTLDHAKLREILRQRVVDGALLRLIGKWLNAGVLEEGRLTRTRSGTPQGGVISPLLANAYLHEVLDVWVERDVLPRLRGRAFLVRYADDFVMVFEHRSDAERLLEVLAKRFAKYGLTLHPTKTRLVRFRRPPDDERPGTFDFLGFTHFWSRSRRGAPVIKRKTSSARLCRALREIADWCRRHLHVPVRDQQRILNAKIRGHCWYYGITGNSPSLTTYHFHVRRIWRRWLCRRSHAARKPWLWFQRLLRVFPLQPPTAFRSVCRRPANP